MDTIKILQNFKLPRYPDSSQKPGKKEANYSVEMPRTFSHLVLLSCRQQSYLPHVDVNMSNADSTLALSSCWVRRTDPGYFLTKHCTLLTQQQGENVICNESTPLLIICIFQSDQSYCYPAPLLSDFQCTASGPPKLIICTTKLNASGHILLNDLETKQVQI